MVHVDVNDVERLARQICKALPAGVVADRKLLRTLATRGLPQALSADWRRRLQWHQRQRLDHEETGGPAQRGGAMRGLTTCGLRGARRVTTSKVGCPSEGALILDKGEPGRHRDQG